MTVIELDRATIKLGGRNVLNDTSLTIGQGEFIGVLGPNGAGKTTLMRAILGLVPASSGAIRVFGKSPTCRRFALCCRTCAFAASISSLVPCTASAGASPRSRTLTAP